MAGSQHELTPELLLSAYRAGIFPMAETRDNPELFWVDPRRRGVIPLNGFHISRSLRRRILSGRFEVTFDRDFPGVVAACADRGETWINAEIETLYAELFARGNAHSAEVWLDGCLVGGVYGVAIGGAFFGESMFSRETDASKVALAYLIDRLNAGGYALFDTQFITDHLSSLGAVEISRQQYHLRLRTALSVQAEFSTGPAPLPQDVVQRNSQTS